MKTKALHPAPILKKIDVWIVDDNPHFCITVADALNQSKSVQCSRTFHRSETFLSELRTGRDLPEVVILDIRLPGTSGLEAIPKIRELSPSSRIIILSAYDEHRNVFDAFSLGASGYLLKTSCSASQVIDAVQMVTRGGVIIDENVAAILLKSLMQRYSSSEKYGLTAKEMEIVDFIAKGLKSKEIAERLKISTTTMIPHLKNIFHKLEVHNRAALVAKVIKEEIV